MVKTHLFVDFFSYVSKNHFLFCLSQSEAGFSAICNFKRLTLLFSCPVVSNSLPPHGLQHTSPSPSPEVCPSSCPLHWWCHTSISSSVPLFSFCSQSFLASGTFPMSQLRIRWPKYWSFSISPFNVYSGLTSLKIDWFYFLAVQGIFRSLLQHHSSKVSILWCSAFFTI